MNHIKKITLAAAGTRLLINKKWRMVTHRGTFQRNVGLNRSAAFVLVQLENKQSVVVMGDLAANTKFIKPKMSDPVLMYQHFEDWRRTCRHVQIKALKKTYVQEMKMISSTFIENYNQVALAQSVAHSMKLLPTSSDSITVI